MNKKIIDILYSRPGMYLESYEKKIDAASIFMSFLSAIFESGEVNYPTSIHLTTAGQLFSIQALECSFPETIEGTANSLANIFNIANYQEPFFDDYYSLGCMRAIVWFAEYCVVEMAIGNKVFRQIFLHGAPQTEQTEKYLQSTEPSINFVFTLPTEPFEGILLDIKRLKLVLDGWETCYSSRMASTAYPQITLQKQWYRQSKHHYSLSMVPAMSASETGDSKTGTAEIDATEIRMAETLSVRSPSDLVPA